MPSMTYARFRRTPRVRGTAIALVLLTAAVVAAISMSFASARRILTPAEVLERDPGDALIEVSGTVARGSVRGDGFVVSGRGQSLLVRYAGPAPDGLAAGRRVRVTGRLRHGQLIAVADGVRITCDGGIPDQHC